MTPTETMYVLTQTYLFYTKQPDADDLTYMQEKLSVTKETIEVSIKLNVIHHKFYFVAIFYAHYFGQNIFLKA